jgi:hypothetical protein
MRFCLILSKLIEYWRNDTFTGQEGKKKKAEIERELIEHYMMRDDECNSCQLYRVDLLYGFNSSMISKFSRVRIWSELISIINYS